MHYQVSRNGQMYGPYTLEDVQRYVASGNVLMSDMVKSEEMPEWIPVSQLLGSQGSGGADSAGGSASQAPQAGYAPVAGGSAQGYSQASPQAYQPMGQMAAAGAGAYPDPPALHWGLVLLFAVLTCGLFQIIWETVQSAWMRKVEPSTKALLLIAGVIVLLLLLGVTAGATGYSNGLAHRDGGDGTGSTGMSALSSLINLAYLVLILAWRFVMRASLEKHFNTAEPIGLRLSGVMTFFFGGLYFQYHLTKIKHMKDAARMGLPRPY